MTTTPTFDRTTERNRLLLAMPQEAVETLLPNLEPCTLELRQVIAGVGEPIRHAYFLSEGVVSILAHAGPGDSVEVGSVGDDGFFGLPLLYGVDREPFEAVVQAPATGWRITAEAFRAAVDESAALRSTLLLYAQAYRIQVGQASACNRAHSLEERCARWLLQMHDRAHGQDFTLTHDFLAAMLGVRRAGVTVAAGHLQQAGLIRYKRGLVSVLDREGLEAGACACYRIVRDAYDAIFRTTVERI